MATNARFTYSREIPELTSWVYQALLADPLRQPILPGVISTLTLTLYDVTTNAIINGLNGQDILNVDRGTVDGAGNLTIRFRPGDTVLVNPAATAAEPHIALVRCTYNTGVDAWVREILHKVTNLNRVP